MKTNIKNHQVDLNQNQKLSFTISNELFEIYLRLDKLSSISYLISNSNNLEQDEINSFCFISNEMFDIKNQIEKILKVK